MTGDTAERKQTQAIELFCELGLSEYEATVYVTLLRFGVTTAREIAESTDVPRTRVYDAAEQLAERGFVDVQHASPKTFRPVSRETVMRKLQLDHETTLGQLSEELTNLEPAERTHEQTGVWSVTDRGVITERVLEFIAEAENEIVYMGVDELLTEEVVNALAVADERGVDIRLGNSPSATRDRIQTAIPSAEPFETLWEFADVPAGRLLMIDRETILISVLTYGGTPEETAIWGGGERNSLVVVLKAIFTWQLNHYENDAGE